MGTKQILTRAIEIVTFLFAAFGHFLLDIAPPEEGGSRMAVGIASFLTLGVLLYISALAKAAPAEKHRKAWFLAAGLLLVAAIVAAPWYRSNLLQHTFPFPTTGSPTSFMKGTELTPRADQYWTSNPQKTEQEVVLDFGGVADRELVWTASSIRKATMILTVHYLVVVLSLAMAIFCVTEGIAAGPKSLLASSEPEGTESTEGTDDEQGEAPRT